MQGQIDPLLIHKFKALFFQVAFHCVAGLLLSGF